MPKATKTTKRPAAKPSAARVVKTKPVNKAHEAAIKAVTRALTKAKSTAEKLSGAEKRAKDAKAKVVTLQKKAKAKTATAASKKAVGSARVAANKASVVFMGAKKDAQAAEKAVQEAVCHAEMEHKKEQARKKALDAFLKKWEHDWNKKHKKPAARKTTGAKSRKTTAKRSTSKPQRAKLASKGRKAA